MIRRTILLFCLLTLAVPAQEQDYLVRLQRATQRAAASAEALTRADLLLTEFANRVESTYLSNSRLVYLSDFEQTASEVRAAAERARTLTADLEVLAADVPRSQRLHQQALRLQESVQKLQRRVEQGELVKAGEKVQTYTGRIIDENRLPRIYALTGGERVLARQLAETTQALAENVEASVKFADQLVLATQPE